MRTLQLGFGVLVFCLVFGLAMAWNNNISQAEGGEADQNSILKMPEKLAVYYGYPSLVDDCSGSCDGNTDCAASVFSD